jgi:Leucine-rich repeat (LRR) protein
MRQFLKLLVLSGINYKFEDNVFKNAQKLMSVSADQTDKQISRLLADQSSNNLALVLELILGISAPTTALRSYVFGIAVFSSEPVLRSRASKILASIASDKTNAEAVRVRETIQYHFDESAFFSRMDNLELGVFDVLLAYKMCLWHRAPHRDSGFATIAHQSLNLSGFEVPKLDRGIAAFHWVRHIWLPAHVGFDVEGSTDLLKHLPLEGVYLESNRMDHFPVTLLSMPRLRILSIRRGRHRPRQTLRVPDGGVWGSPVLEHLVVEGYPIEGEDRLGPFPCLREVDIHRCKLRGIPFLSQSGVLERLSLRNNSLTALPDFIGTLSCLREVDMTENPWETIALDLSGLKELKKIAISR